MIGKDNFVLTNASEETVRDLWNNFNAYRYDVDCSFFEFLDQNGIYVRMASPYLNLFGYSISEIEIALN